MKEFKTFHPVVNLTYFIFVIGFACFFLHPVSLVISWMGAFTYSVMLKGKKAMVNNLIYMIPMLIIAPVFNSLFNHEGMTVLWYFSDGNPFTLESFVYGFSAGVMIVSVICFFSSFNEIMTSDKIIYLFGRIIPKLSLVLSMTLRFVPRFAREIKNISKSRKCMGFGTDEGNALKRAKNGLSILSGVTTMALENSVDTADSMKARGYGIGKRTYYSLYKFDSRDLKAFLYIVILGIYVLAGSIYDGMYFKYFPTFRYKELTGYSISLYLSHFMLCMCPVIIEIWEVLKWKYLKSKI